MKLSRSTFETQVFVLDWSSVEKIHSEVAARLPIVSISARCVDQLDRKFSSLDELKAFDNPARAEIVELCVAGRDASHDQRISISLSTESRSNIRIKLDANEDVGMELNSFSNDIVESLRPWYSWVAKADWYWVILFGWIASQFLLFTLKLALAGDKVIQFTEVEHRTAQETLRLIAIGITPLVSGLFLNALRDKFFPIGVFAIGQGEKRHASKEVTRTVLIAGFGVSIVTSLAFAWFS